MLNNQISLSDSEFRVRAANQVINEGISYVSNLISAEEFEGLANALGNIISDFAVKIDSTKVSYVCHSEAIPFHTDDLSCRYIGWHCISQDSSDGGSLLLHTQKVFALLSPTELEILSQVKIEPAPYAKGPSEPYPLLHEYPSNPGICYVPWLKIHSSNDAQKNALERLKEAIAIVENSGDFVEIKLQPGQALFIDNWRVFHGRRELKSDSPRHLRRLWVGAAETTNK